MLIQHCTVVQADIYCHRLQTEPGTQGIVISTAVSRILMQPHTALLHLPYRNNRHDNLAPYNYI